MTPLSNTASSEDHLLESLVRVPGVLGASLLDERWRCQAIRMPAPYEPILVEQAGRLLEDIGHAHASVADGRVVSLILQCAEGTLYLRRTSSGKAFLLLCDATLKSALLEVSLNVASLKLENLRSTPPRALEATDPLPATDESQTTRQSGLASGVQPRGKPPARPPTDTTTGFFTTAATTTSATSATRSSAVKLQALKAVLERYVGKRAKPMIKEEIQRLGGMSGDKIRINFDELVAVLMRRIPQGMRERVMADLQQVVPDPNRGTGGGANAKGITTKD